MEQVYLSKRNLLALLSKLERVEKGEFSYCTLLSYRNIGTKYEQTMDEIAITAVSDEEYYSDQPVNIIYPGDEQ